MNRTVIMLALSVMTTAHGSLESSHPSAFQEEICPGCIGAGGAASVNGGGCQITLSVNVASGTCKAAGQTDPPVPNCRQTQACQAVMTGTYSGLPGNSELEACATIGGTRYCIDDPPFMTDPSGSGMAMNERGMGCKANNPVDFEFAHPSCGAATVTAICTPCAE